MRLDWSVDEKTYLEGAMRIRFLLFFLTYDFLVRSAQETPYVVMVSFDGFRSRLC
jgi:hypothetical protein